MITGIYHVQIRSRFVTPTLNPNTVPNLDSNPDPNPKPNQETNCSWTGCTQLHIYNVLCTNPQWLNFADNTLTPLALTEALKANKKPIKLAKLLAAPGSNSLSIQ